MWHKVCNSNDVKPDVVDRSSSTRVLLRKNFTLIPATEESPAHYEYEECALTPEEYELTARLDYLSLLVEA